MISNLNKFNGGREMSNNILIYSEGKELIVEHLYTVEGYFTFNIKVRSGDFAGASHFCMPKEKVISIIEEISNMYKDLTGSCQIRDYDSDANIAIEMTEFGHMCVYGQIGGSHEDHSMKFKYNSDQTVLANLTQMLKALL